MLPDHQRLQVAEATSCRRSSCSPFSSRSSAASSAPACSCSRSSSRSRSTMNIGIALLVVDVRHARPRRAERDELHHPRAVLRDAGRLPGLAPGRQRQAARRVAAALPAVRARTRRSSAAECRAPGTWSRPRPGRCSSSSSAPASSCVANGSSRCASEATTVRRGRLRRARPGRPRIFGIGLNKTATTSLDRALTDLGFLSLHHGATRSHDAVMRAVDEAGAAAHVPRPELRRLLRHRRVGPPVS